MTRDEILARLRATRQAGAVDATLPPLLPRGPPLPDRAERFTRELVAVGGEVTTASADGWPAEVQRIASAARLRHVLADPRIDVARLGLQRVTADEAWRRPDATLGLAWADAAVAETGSLVFARDGTHAPTSFTHVTIALVRGRDIVPSLADLPPPRDDERSRVLLTGPSRTSDIEKRLVLGAQGPQRVVAVVVDG